MTQVKHASSCTAELVSLGSGRCMVQGVGQPTEPRFELDGLLIYEGHLSEELLPPRAATGSQHLLGEAAATRCRVSQESGGSCALGGGVLGGGLVEVDIDRDQRVIRHRRTPTSAASA